MTREEATRPTRRTREVGVANVREVRLPPLRFGSVFVDELFKKRGDVSEFWRPGVILLHDPLKALRTPCVNHALECLENTNGLCRKRRIGQREDMEGMIQGSDGKKIPSIGVRE